MSLPSCPGHIRGSPGFRAHVSFLMSGDSASGGGVSRLPNAEGDTTAHATTAWLVSVRSKLYRNHGHESTTPECRRSAVVETE